MRNSVVMIFVNNKESKKVHFCCHDILSGSNNNIWFPIFDEKTLFSELEKIMISCRVANNVTLIKKLRCGNNEGGYYEDYEVIYNEI